jgi:hypothetical protein
MPLLWTERQQVRGTPWGTARWYPLSLSTLSPSSSSQAGGLNRDVAVVCDGGAVPAVAQDIVTALAFAMPVFAILVPSAVRWGPGECRLLTSPSQAQ